MQWPRRIRGSYPFRAAHWINSYHLGHLLLVETAGNEREVITELITQLALRGPFNLIAGDEWLPDRDTLYRSVRRSTLAVEETLAHPILMRPMTCLQLLDLLMETDMQNKPTLILNFLHHFYNADVELSLRDRILEQCCHHTKRLALSNSVVVLVPRLSTNEYRRFFPLLASIANEIIPVKENPTAEAIQGLLF
ncbi:MAG TPA: hypothetical protein VJM08_01865 [Anaerolineales bacterium]|nr:hypothetical protein [Anaerolineales bacterium]